MGVRRARVFRKYTQADITLCSKKNAVNPHVNIHMGEYIVVLLPYCLMLLDQASQAAFLHIPGIESNKKECAVYSRVQDC